MFSDGPALKSLLEGEIRKLAEQLATGMCEEYSQYKHITGVIEGLTRSIRVIDEYSKSLIEQVENETEH
jgi:hypothetical protein